MIYLKSMCRTACKSGQVGHAPSAHFTPSCGAQELQPTNASPNYASDDTGLKHYEVFVAIAYIASELTL